MEDRIDKLKDAVVFRNKRNKLENEISGLSIRIENCISNLSQAKEALKNNPSSMDSDTVLNMVNDMLELTIYQNTLLVALIKTIKDLPVLDIDKYFSSISNELSFIVKTTNVIEKRLA